MGFKCPVCKKDFGKNKDEWQRHCSEQHFGVGKDIINLVKLITSENLIMKKKVEKKVKVVKAAAPKAAGNEYQQVTLADIVSNPHNPRKNFAGPKFEELIASIRQVGVIEPILIRPVKGKTPYEIIAGERRWRASCDIANANGVIKKNTIPAIVRNVSDDEAFDLMTIENLQREDLTELEEAQSFKIYLDKKGKEALPELAERTGIKPSYIMRRVSVLALPKEVLKAWEKGTIKYGHCEQLVRVADKNKMLELFKEVAEQNKWNPVTVQDLKDQIEEDAVKLSHAKFDLEKAGCKKCQSSSDVQRDLFGEDVQKSQCLNPKCFKQNQNNWFMANWQKEFKKQTGTNGFRFAGDVDYNKKHDFESWIGKPGAKCKECAYFVSFINVEGEIRQKQSCVGDKSCFNAIIAASKQEAKKKAAAKAQASGSGEQENTGEEIDTPRVAWHDGFFIEEFYKEAIPRSVAAIPDNDLKGQEIILRLSLISLFISNRDVWQKFALKWMPHYCHYSEEVEGIVKNGNDEDKIWACPTAAIWDDLKEMTYGHLVQVHQEISANVIMQQNGTSAQMRHLVAMHLGIDLAKEWRITKDYLDKKTTKEILQIIDKLGIATDEKALAYLHEILNKKRGKFNTCKKTELVSLIMDSGVDLAGKVPDEILTAAAKLEHPEDDEE